MEDSDERRLLIDFMNELVPQLYHHQLLGSARELQGPIFREIPYWLKHAFPETRKRFTEQELAGEGWVLLAQLGEYRRSPQLIIGDAGTLYFVMPEVDLKKRRFARVMGIMQCH